MIRIRPFEAIRPHPNRAAHVASVPYDVVTADEARALAEGEPDSFLHVIRPEIDLPPGTDPHDDAVYEQARTCFQRMLADGILFHDRRPAMFLYRQVIEHRSQIGLVCCCHVDDYRQDRIKKHERTRRDKEDDRTRHVLTTGAHAGPVFMAYRDRAAIDDLVFEDTNERPLYHFNAPDGVTHTVWEIREPDPYLRAFTEIDAVYVADGHHRAASAERAAAERARANPAHTGDEDYNWFLAALFPSSQLTILAYNRVVADLGGLTGDTLLERLGGLGRLAAASDAAPDRAGVICLYLDGRWHRLELDAASIDTADPIASLDVSLLQTRILEPLLGIGDPRIDPRLDFVGGGRGTETLSRMVDEGRAAVAFSLYPTAIEQLLAVADAGLVMPPKSTWFEPKLRSGLLVHSLDPVPAVGPIGRS